MFILVGLMIDCTFMPTKEKNLILVNLRCSQVENPLAINNLTPRLSWELPSFEETQKQQAYQILVSSSKKDLDKNIGILWDSGKINSDQSQHIEYGGKQPYLESE